MARVELQLYTPVYIPTGDEIAVFHTVKGDIRVQLLGKTAPVTVGNFIELARKGFYDNLKFHAFKKESAIIGGCPITRSLGPAQVDAAARGIIHGIHPGRGDAGYVIVDEVEGRSDNRHLVGSLVSAHKSEPNSGSCQFYFSLAEQPQYDGEFTVFGQTVEGIDVLQKLWIGDAILGIDIENYSEA